MKHTISCRLRKRWKAWPACWICNFSLKRPAKKYGGQPLISFENHAYTATPYWNDLKENKEFQCYVQDILDYGTYRFESLYVHDEPEIIKGFVRYGRYSRKDVSRILNYETNREGTLNGYQIVGVYVSYFASPMRNVTTFRPIRSTKTSSSRHSSSAG